MSPAMISDWCKSTRRLSTPDDPWEDPCEPGSGEVATVERISFGQYDETGGEEGNQEWDAVVPHSGWPFTPQE